MSPGPPDKSLYAALGVAPDATEDEIKRAYRQLATTLHPDKTDAARREEAAALFTTVQEAYEASCTGCVAVIAELQRQCCSSACRVAC